MAQITWDTPASGATVATADSNSTFRFYLSGEFSDTYVSYKYYVTTGNRSAILFYGNPTYTSRSYDPEDSFSKTITGTTLSVASTTNVSIELGGYGIDSGGGYHTLNTCTVYATVRANAPTIIFPELATGLSYTGSTQILLSEAGSCSGGTLYYGLGTDATTEPESWHENTSYTNIAGTNAGTYYIWYKVTGDSTHSSIAATYWTTNSITKADQIFTYANIAGLKKKSTSMSIPSTLPAGTLNVSSDNTSVATAIIDAATGNVAITGVGEGTANITVVASGNSNYNARTQVFVVTVIKGGASFLVTVNGTWKECDEAYVNVNGTWKEATTSVNIGGTWK